MFIHNLSSPSSSLLRSSCMENNSFRPEVDFVDPLPEKLKRTVVSKQEKGKRMELNGRDTMW